MPLNLTGPLSLNQIGQMQDLLDRQIGELKDMRAGFDAQAARQRAANDATNLLSSRVEHAQFSLDQDEELEWVSHIPSTTHSIYFEKGFGATASYSYFAVRVNDGAGLHWVVTGQGARFSDQALLDLIMQGERSASERTIRFLERIPSTGIGRRDDKYGVVRYVVDKGVKQARLMVVTAR